MFGSAPWFNNASIATSQFLCWAAIIKGFVWDDIYILSNIDHCPRNILAFPNVSRVENDKNHSGIWSYQSVSPSLRVPRSKSAPSLINTSIIAFIDFLKFIHHYIISDFGPLGRTVQMRIIQIEMGWVGVMVHNLWIIIFRLGFLPRAFGSKMTYNCSAIFIEWININTNWHFVQLKLFLRGIRSMFEYEIKIRFYNLWIINQP